MFLSLVNSVQDGKYLKQSSTEAGWVTAQAGPCLAGVFQPME